MSTTNEEQYIANPGAVGNEGCQCRNESTVLASLHKRTCETSEGQKGILLTVEGPCVPYSYGSNNCLPYDLMHDPKCNTMFESPEDYCSRSWCYVDSSSCMLSSDERLYRSTYFPHYDGVDLFYSYTTCNSSSDDKLTVPQKHTLGGITLMATSPTYYFPPYIFKRNSTGDIITDPDGGNEYYNNSVPFEGVFVNYLKKLEDLADGDFQIKFTHGSRASQTVHPDSSYNAAVQDIEDGLVDMAVSSFWVTGERLQKVAFTTPLHNPVVLIIPKPKEDDSLSAQTSKVLEPFTMWAWFLIVAVIIFAAGLTVFFSDRSKLAKKKGKGLREKKSNRRVKSVYARLMLDALLENGIFFCSAGVSQDEGASLPHKILMFGFGFFILIVVSAYVANLAAFLTKSGVNEYVGTMDEVNAKGLKVCAQSAIQTELEVEYSSTTFVYSQSGTVQEMADDYEANKCDFLVVGRNLATVDIEAVNLFCEKNLVVTDSIVIDTPVAFPIRHNLVAGLSYWIHEGEKHHGISVEASQKEYDGKYGRKSSCNVELSTQENTASDDNAYITPKNLFFPVVFFAACAILATMLELHRQRKLKQGKRASIFGRTSTLCLEPVHKLDLDAGDEIQPARSIAKGTISSDRIDLDEFHECSNDQDNDRSLLLDQINQILVCVQELKRQKDH